MCDFSMLAKGQRDCRNGESLVVTQFGSHTRGTASPTDRSIAVCLPSGACLMIPALPREIRQRFGLPKNGETVAIFMQLPHRENEHRDALTFENGRTMLMNELPLGLSLTVHYDRVSVPSTTPVRRSVVQDVASRVLAAVGH